VFSVLVRAEVSDNGEFDGQSMDLNAICILDMEGIYRSSTQNIELGPAFRPALHGTAFSSPWHSSLVCVQDSSMYSCNYGVPDASAISELLYQERISPGPRTSANGRILG
jgi:hypothetical protein